MAVVVVAELEGGTQDLYDAVTPRVMEGGNLPEGCHLHLAGPYAAGWRVITVWDSEDKFQEFREARLLPALREADAGDRVPPKITAEPVHRLITG
jgi:hypothetical protein